MTIKAKLDNLAERMDANRIWINSNGIWIHSNRIWINSRKITLSCKPAWPCSSAECEVSSPPPAPSTRSKGDKWGSAMRSHADSGSSRRKTKRRGTLFLESAEGVEKWTTLIDTDGLTPAFVASKHSKIGSDRFLNRSLHSSSDTPKNRAPVRRLSEQVEMAVSHTYREF